MDRRLICFALLGSLGVALTAGAVRSADELQGAAAALKALQQRQMAPGADPNSPNAIARLRAAIDKLEKEGPTLPPAEAAQRWLALLDTFEGLDYNEAYSGDGVTEPVQLMSLFEALPPPASWPSLVAGLEQRKPKAKLPPLPPAGGVPGAPGFAGGMAAQGTLGDPALRLLIAALKDDREAQWREMAALLPLCRKDASGASQQFVSLYQILARQSGDPKRIARAVEFQITMFPRGEEAGYWQPFPIPDLVKLVGPKEAERILKLGLTLPGVQLQLEGENATSKLARSLALQMLPQLRWPQWILAQSIDAMPLYEAMSKRFKKGGVPPAGGNAAIAVGPPGFNARQIMIGEGQDPLETSRHLAAAHYFLGLIATGRSTEAAALLPRINLNDELFAGIAGSALSALQARNKLPALEAFLREHLRKKPELPVWSLSFGVADRRRLPQEEIAFLRTALTNVDLHPTTRRRIRQRLSELLLADDAIDEGIAVLRQMLASSLRDSEDEGSDGDTGESYLVQNWAASLLRLGQLLKRPELIRDTVALLKRQPARPDESGAYFSTDLADQLIAAGEFREAETLLIASLVSFARQTPPNQPVMQGQEHMVRLASLYHRAGRPEDALRVLKEAPNWASDDLAGVLLQQDGQGQPLGYVAAASLAKAGDRDRAKRVLESLMLQKADCAAAYALYAELNGPASLTFLDRLIARDRFEPLSLIWKAEVLRRSGRLDEAEVAARAALALEPSDRLSNDGGRKAGDVLADILAARGRLEDAEGYRKRSRAMAVADEGERLHSAGLRKRAVEAFQQAVQLAPGDAAHHLSLATLLEREQDKAGAEEHLRKGLAGLVDATGPLGSEIASMQLAVSSPAALDVAEKTFAEVAQRSPEKPQPHYLLGLVAKARDKKAQAYRHFAEATRRDPDFLAAWSEIVGLAGDSIEAQDQDLALKAMLRLDPGGRHSSRDFTNVRSAKTLYEAVASARLLFKEAEPAPLLTLEGSKAVIDKFATENPLAFSSQRAGFRMNPNFGYDLPGVHALPKPGAAVAGHPVAAGAIALLEIDLMQRRQAAAIPNG